MNAPLADWARPQFEPGGGDPAVFYVVFGKTPNDVSLSGSAYRCAGVPPGIEILRYGPDQHPEVLDGFRTGPVGDQVARDDPALAEAIAAQEECIVLRGQPQGAETLNYHRDIVGLITWLCDEGAVGVLDATAIAWWSPDRWRSHAFSPNGPAPRHHVRVLHSDEPTGRWLHTRGMAKYGRPDLSIRHVTQDRWDISVEIVNRFIELLAFGGVVPDGQPISMSGAPEGMICRHRGHADDPDFNNTHIEVLWPGDA